MRTIFNTLLRGILPAALALFALVPTALQAQDLVHRYEFEGDVNDSIGAADGTASQDGTFTEEPQFDAIVPSGAKGPKESIEFGRNADTLKSFVSLPHSTIRSLAAAGSVSMFLRPEATSCVEFRYAIVALNLPEGFNIGQRTSGSEEVLRAGVNEVILGSFPINPDDWYHVVLTWEQSGADLIRSFYVNGVEVAADTAIGSLDLVTAVRLGSFNALDDGHALNAQFDGRMYDLQIYDGVLSPDQVKTLFNNPGTTARKRPAQ